MPEDRDRGSRQGVLMIEGIKEWEEGRWRRGRMGKRWKDKNRKEAEEKGGKEVGRTNCEKN